MVGECSPRRPWSPPDAAARPRRYDRSVTAPVPAPPITDVHAPRSSGRRIATIIAVPLLTVALSGSLSGCYSGFGATTNMQATQNTGNGVRATIGAMLIDTATIIRGPAGTTSGTLVVAISNRGKEEDQLLDVTIGGVPATLQPAGAVAVPPNGIVRFGFNADRWINTYVLDAPVSGYVPVTMTFAKAGILEISVLTVEPTGYYAGITPNPASPPAAPAS